MTQQLLNDFDILTIGLEDRRKRVAKRVPRELFRDPQLPSYGLDMVAHYSAQPNRLLTAFRSCTVRLGSPHIVLNVPSVAGQLGAGYAVPMLYVPALFWTHLVAFWLLLRPARMPVRSAGAPVSLPQGEYAMRENRI